jgi:hypothetical protein
MIEPDYQEIRDRYLSQLKLGKQAPSYKAVAKALDYLISQLKSEASTSDSSRARD